MADFKVTVEALNDTVEVSVTAESVVAGADWIQFNRDTNATPHTVVAAFPTARVVSVTT
jgi:hypothetical protein